MHKHVIPFKIKTKLVVVGWVIMCCLLLYWIASRPQVAIAFVIGSVVLSGA